LVAYEQSRNIAKIYEIWSLNFHCPWHSRKIS